MRSRHSEIKAFVDNSRDPDMQMLVSAYEDLLALLGMHGAEPAIRGCLPAER